MIQNLFKTSFRLLWRDRFYTLLNIAGLSIGMAAAVFMFLWAGDELTYDHMHPNGERIYRVLTNWKFGEEREYTSSCSAPLTDEARNSVPGIDQMVRTWDLGEQTFLVGPNAAALENVSLVEQGYFTIFQFPFLLGNAQTALSQPGNLVLTESSAIKLFGKIPDLGATLRHPTKGDFQVGAILKDLPTNSSIQFDAVLPWEGNVPKFARNPKDAFRWGQINFPTWVLLRPDADPAKVAEQFSVIAGKERSGDEAFYYALQNVRDIHFYSGFLRWGDYGSLATVRVVGLIGLLVLLIACINYVNLTMARTVGRARMVGIRQAIGAGKWQLFGQSMLESGITVLIATLFAAGLTWLGMPAFEKIGGKDFTLSQVFGSQSLAILGGTALIAWLASGLHPATQMSRFKPVTALKGEVPGSGSHWLRRILVTSQFVFSIGLGICALLIFKQLQFTQEKKLGFDREHAFMFFVPDDRAAQLKAELTQQPGILGVSCSDNPFVDLGSQCSGDNWEGKTPEQPSDLWQINVDPDFPQFFNLELAEGRWFNPGVMDSTSFVINESAVKMMQFQGSPLGKWMDHGGIRGTIVGVCKDFHFKSLHNRIEPMIFSSLPGFYVFHVKTSGAQAAQAIASSQAFYQKVYPNKIFKYHFLDELYNDLYKSEARVAQLTGVFTGLALFISCLGLFGLAAFAAAQRTKEIGIRKTLGASVASVVALLSKDFVKMVLITLIIASPLAYYLMQQWLAEFAYQMAFPWWVFPLVGILAVLLAFITVSFQSIKAALENPVKALRSE
ncbi:MAG TPA: ABC transporter permease [Saprospiraceae bacterium]|nr:ABC transporter permease [Saprospiraceae bacterium]